MKKKTLLTTTGVIGTCVVGALGANYAFGESTTITIDEELPEEQITYEDTPLFSEVPQELPTKVNIQGLKGENPNTFVDQKITKNYINKDRWAKRLSREEGKKKIDLIREYSLKIGSAFRCTGWFLDYEIPKGNKKYPTKWFIATNLHCINGISFRKDHYNTTLPKTHEGQRNLYSIPLSKENIEYHSKHPTVEFKEENWDSYSVRDEPVVWSTKADALKDIKDPNPDVWTYTDANPRLVYAAVDFLGDYKTAKEKHGYPFDTKKYYKDFAVIEINFDTEEQAKRTTWNFYNKYDPVVGERKGQGIDFFAKELIARKTPDQLVEEQEDIFISGYPVNAWNKHISVSNYSETRESASRLTRMGYMGNYEVKNEDGEPVLGHFDAGTWLYNDAENRARLEIYWNGEPIRDWGYRYSIDYKVLEGGGSGSLSMDSSNNLLGLYSYGYHYGIGGIEPIRSEGIRRNGVQITPKYDLIEGVEGQVSYRSQLEKYFLKDGFETNLSRQRKWTSQPPKGR